jgi:hypothetical protein
MRKSTHHCDERRSQATHKIISNTIDIGTLKKRAGARIHRFSGNLAMYMVNAFTPGHERFPMLKPLRRSREIGRKPLSFGSMVARRNWEKLADDGETRNIVTFFESRETEFFTNVGFVLVGLYNFVRQGRENGETSLVMTPSASGGERKAIGAWRTPRPWLESM